MTQIFTVCNCFAIKNRQKISKNMNSFKPAEKVTLEFQSPFITCLPSSFWEERGIMFTMDPYGGFGQSLTLTLLGGKALYHLFGVGQVVNEFLLYT